MGIIPINGLWEHHFKSVLTPSNGNLKRFNHFQNAFNEFRFSFEEVQFGHLIAGDAKRIRKVMNLTNLMLDRETDTSIIWAEVRYGI